MLSHKHEDLDVLDYFAKRGQNLILDGPAFVQILT